MSFKTGVLKNFTNFTGISLDSLFKKVGASGLQIYSKETQT